MHQQLNVDEQIAAGIEPGLLQISLSIGYMEDTKNDLSQVFAKG